MTLADNNELLGAALTEIQQLRIALEASEDARAEPVALVGMACRMPGADDVSAFWRLLRDGRDMTGDIPADRFDVEAYYDPDPKTPGKMYTRRGAFLDDIDLFDAAFFGISPREAAQMDPQQRLFLEVAWEALEHAGQPIGKLGGSSTGVFMGVTGFDYSQTVMQGSAPSDLNAYSMTGGLAATFTPGRLAYSLGLQGPCLAVDTACSSSLVAVHLALQSLRSGDCTMALAGGVNVLLSPEWFVVLSNAGMLAADGRCKTFDSAADGYVRGEGCGVVVLKPLSAALADRDRVLAVIRGSAVNQDGRSSGITVPNGTAQRAVIREALQRAGVAGRDIGYVEAHGTGTPLGDPIEVHALADVLGEDRDPATPIVVGSVKTNIGHLEPAAGVAGLIKTVLALRHEQVPPLLHLRELNHEIPAAELAVSFPTTLTPWPRREQPRFAAVSSFGASGTNAHLVVEEAPTAEPSPGEADRPTHLVCLSARTGEALDDLVARHLRHHDKNPDSSLADIAFTANRGRAHFPHRLAVRADDVAQLRTRLAAHAAGTSAEGLHSATATSRTRLKVAFLFSGQGAQYQNMSRALFDTQPGFRHDLERCDELLREHLDRPLLSVIFPRPGDEALINQTRYTQPALFAVQYALARLWRRWGITPAALLGHSVGEYAAMCVAEVLTLEDGLALIAERARLMHELPAGGGMTALFADPERVTEALRPYAGQLSIAAVNALDNVVVAGAQEHLDELAATLAAEGVKSTPLRVSHAFHSPLIEPMLDAFENRCERVSFAAPRIPLVSNLTGQVADSTTFTARYLRRHAREPVHFMAGLRQLAERGCRTFLEIGPTPVLCGTARRTLTDPDNGWLASLRPGRPNWTTLLDALGELYVRGADVDWEGVDSDYQRRSVELPTYPFQRKRHWFQASAPRVRSTCVGTSADTSDPSDTPVSTSAQVLPAAPAGNPRSSAGLAPTKNGSATPVLGRRLPSPLEVKLYQATLTVDEHPGLDENVVDGTPVVNAGFYLEAALGAAADLFDAEQVHVSQLLVPQALVMPADGRQVTQVVVEPHGEESASFGYYGLIPGTEDSWTLYAGATVRPAAGAPPTDGPDDIEAIRRRCTDQLEGGDFYRALWKRRVHLGPTAKWLERIRCTGGEALAWMRKPENGEGQPYRLHPGIVDSALQLVFACVADELASDTLVILSELEDYRFYGYDGGQLLCHARLRARTTASGMVTADIRLVTERGACVASLAGVHLRLAGRDTLLQAIRTAPRPASPRTTGAGRPGAGRTSGPAVGRASGTWAPGRLRELLIECTAAVLGGSREDIDAGEPLQSLGFDSLMAVELRDAVAGELGITVPAITFLDNPSVSGLESELLSLLGGGPEQPSAGPRPAVSERTGPGGMHVAELGSGPPVVFVHGGAFAGMDAWQTQAPLSRRWRLVIPSRLNYGLSAAGGREDFAEDARLIAELLGEGAHLVAQSYGTIGAMLAAVERPEAVWSLTLVESAASGVARGVPVVDDYERGAKALLAASWDDPEQLFRQVFALIEPTARFPSPLPRDLRRFAERMPAIRWPWEAEIPYDRLRAAAIPTLVVTGGERPVFEEIGDALAKRLDGERLIVPGGHGTQNAGTPFNEALAAFLDRAHRTAQRGEAR